MEPPLSERIPSDLELEDLEREAPHLSRLRRFALSLERLPWFANLGEPPSAATRATARDYLDALGFPEAELAILPSWEDAAAAAESIDWNTTAWEAEELARADMTATALSEISEEALTIAQTFVAQRAGDAVKEAMEQAAALWDWVDEAARRAAEGAAIQAANGAALTLAAAAVDSEIEAESHLFAHKFRLYEFGRWPVGVAGLSFNVF